MQIQLDEWVSKQGNEIYEKTICHDNLDLGCAYGIDQDKRSDWV